MTYTKHHESFIILLNLSVVFSFLIIYLFLALPIRLCHILVASWLQNVCINAMGILGFVSQCMQNCHNSYNILLSLVCYCCLFIWWNIFGICLFILYLCSYLFTVPFLFSVSIHIVWSELECVDLQVKSHCLFCMKVVSFFRWPHYYS